jgi:hypothetical protein
MFFGGYDDEDDDDTHETSLQKDEMENLDDAAPELDLGEPSSKVMEFARMYLGESPDTRSSVVEELRDMIYGQYRNRIAHL